jgi:5-formyltetrahydrofolate cyclo-ligase
MSLINTTNKTKVRRHVLHLRESIPADIRKQKDMAIVSKLLALPEFIVSKSILLYASFGSEVGTRNLIEYCLNKGVVVALPRVVREHERLDIYKIANIADLVPGYRDIPEPLANPETHIKIDDIDLVVTPGVAFDESCNRIGYGKGYYDKLLGSAAGTKNRPKPFFAALAYEEQIVPSISCEPYDINMDAVITDKRIIYRHGS